MSRKATCFSHAECRSNLNCFVSYLRLVHRLCSEVRPSKDQSSSCSHLAGIFDSEFTTKVWQYCSVSVSLVLPLLMYCMRCVHRSFIWTCARIIRRPTVRRSPLDSSSHWFVLQRSLNLTTLKICYFCFIQVVLLERNYWMHLKHTFYQFILLQNHQWNAAVFILVRNTMPQQCSESLIAGCMLCDAAWRRELALNFVKRQRSRMHVTS